MNEEGVVHITNSLPAGSKSKEVIFEYTASKQSGHDVIKRKIKI
jgi:hypothetical protein